MTLNQNDNAETLELCPSLIIMLNSISFQYGCGFYFDTHLYLTGAVNVVAMLHNFWEQRQAGQSNGSSSDSDSSDGDTAVQTESLLLYESASSPGPPYVCYVTLPGGSCFGNYKVC